MKYSPEQAKMSAGDAVARLHGDRVNTRDSDRVQRLHPVVVVVCPGCGARIGKPCVSTVRTLGVGSVGTPIDGVHAERIAAAREQGFA